MPPPRWRSVSAGAASGAPYVGGASAAPTMPTVELPASIDPALARLALAIGLFQEEAVTVGRAAEVAGLSYRAFLDALRDRGIPAFEPTDEDLQEDFAFAEAFVPREPA